MGTLIRYTGDMKILEDKREEFTERLLTLLYHGGMMQFEKVSIYGKKIALLKPVEINKRDGNTYFNFNYFEDDAWECVSYNADNAELSSNKIGSEEFADVITAAYFLYESYDKEIGYVEVDGHPVNVCTYVGWINHVLGTSFSMEKRFQIWNNFEKYCLERQKGGYSTEFDMSDVWQFVPKQFRGMMGGIEFTDICYILQGTEGLLQEEILPGTYPAAVYKCKEALRCYFNDEKYGEERTQERIWNLIKCDREVREKEREDSLKEIAKLSIELPARVIVYLTAEILHLDFWDEWKTLVSFVYHDEIMPSYASEDVVKMRDSTIKEKIMPIDTSQFLYDDSQYLFWDTPNELKNKENYYISDDERAFWWDGTSEVEFSKEMEQWLEELNNQYKQIVSDLYMNEDEHKENLAEELISTLALIEEDYQRVFAFHNMFYEFIQNGGDYRYYAALKLMQKVAKDNKSEGKIIKTVHNWSTASRNVKRNIGRLRMKRFLAVMANSMLRKKKFGF